MFAALILMGPNEEVLLLHSNQCLNRNEQEDTQLGEHEWRGESKELKFSSSKKPFFITTGYCHDGNLDQGIGGGRAPECGLSQ